MATYAETVLADSPQVYFKLDETSGTSAADASGHGRTGTFADSPILSEAGAGPGSTKSVKFVGPNDRLYVSGYTTVLQQFTIELWLKVHDYPASGKFYELASKRSYYAGSTGDFPFYLSLGNSGRLGAGFSTGNDYSQDLGVSGQVGSELVKDVWHHVALTWNGTTVTLYLDGVSVGTASQTLTLSTNSQPWTFGMVCQELSGGVGTTGLTGWMDEIAIYSTALSLARIQAHFAAMNPAAPISITQALALESLGDVTVQAKVLVEYTGLQQIGMTTYLPFGFAGIVQAPARLPLGATGYVGSGRTMPIDVLVKLVLGRRLLPLDAWGIFNALYHRWLVQRYGVGDVQHVWQVLQRAAVTSVPHRWTVQTSAGGGVPHLWRVIPPQLIALRGKDIQLPYGKIEKVG